MPMWPKCTNLGYKKKIELQKYGTNWYVPICGTKIVAIKYGTNIVSNKPFNKKKRLGK